MKITRIGPDAVFHRYLTPKWAFLPISGAGAAIDGGRFNRPGVEALYLSGAPKPHSKNIDRARASRRRLRLQRTR